MSEVEETHAEAPGQTEGGEDQAPSLPVTAGAGTEDSSPVEERLLEQAAGEVVESLLKTLTLEMRSSFSGPLPPPSILQRYNEVCPGAAERLLARFEKQSDHRMSMERARLDMERRSIEAHSRRADRGQWFALAIAMAFLGVSGWVINGGHAVAGTVLGTFDLVALVSVFHYVKSRRDEQHDHDQQIEPSEPRGG